MALFSESVEILCSPAAVPLQMTWHGQDYAIEAEPLRWYERRAWWVEETRAERGSGTSLVDHEIWRVQARLKGQGELLTFDLTRHLASGRWRLLRLHDGVQVRSA
ncbi:hypothetical protein IV498_15230 [Paenarthrobacter sp. Z7-10]|uniref:DUF6504 family protein n=1 Tax=Paenarthrobacter sp. Z7-10 TaxID=2787635 RepID=UPI0022A9D6EB|nr:DUF6504 family protein [Paenarthrobacter sp. Z7-10]MCZ2404493.1 hypothetical protein [Paenarthrobacter sp. Z7-10]